MFTLRRLTAAFSPVARDREVTFVYSAGGTAADAFPLHRFHGGIHPSGHKADSSGRPIAPLAPEGLLVLPLQQHIGQSAEPVVEVGEQVLKGQLLAKPVGYISAALHAPTSGIVAAIGPAPTPHPSGLPQLAITLQPDGADRWIERQPVADFRKLDPSALRTLIRNAGIVGLGGASFPTAVKMNPGEHHDPVLILNGAECEPYITCDDILMRERADEILQGAEIMLHALGGRRCLVGIEGNKPEAIAAMRRAAAGHANMTVVEVPTVYPMGGAKQLIEALTGRQIPAGGHSIDIGVVCVNVGTAYATKRAVLDGEPLVSRIVTVAGHVRQPQNFEAPLGLSMERLIQAAGGPAGPVDRVLMGGPLMGVALHRTDVPVIKAANCVLVMAPEQAQPVHEAMPCIRCAACVEACPASLMPHDLYWFARAQNFDKAQEYNIFDCIECGACAYVCPSEIPLVHYFRYAKQEIAAIERDREKADLARRRNEARLARIAREKAEAEAKRAEKMAAMARTKEAQANAATIGEAAAGAATPAATLSPEQKAAIEAALARRREREAAAGNADKPKHELTPEQLAKIEAAKARKAAQTAGPAPERDTKSQ
ncbi:MAG: electron transport complex subunit RsxC [Pseudomonadota bacterium]